MSWTIRLTLLLRRMLAERYWCIHTKWMDWNESHTDEPEYFLYFNLFFFFIPWQTKILTKFLFQKKNREHVLGRKNKVHFNEPEGMLKL
jgi:hypothetical protein